LLRPYSLTVGDEEAKTFQFSFTYSGELQMKAPLAFIREGDQERLKKLNYLFKSKPGIGIAEVIRPKPLTDTIIDFEVGYLLNINSQRLKLGFELEAIKIYRKADKTDLKKLSFNQAANLPLLKGLSNEVYSLLLQLSDSKLLDYLESRGLGYMKTYGSPWQQMTERGSSELKKHYVECLQKLWPYLAEHPQTFLLKEGKFSSNNCKPAIISPVAVDLSFRVTADQRFITIQLIPLINEDEIEPGFELLHGFLFNSSTTFHILKNIEDLPVLEQFNNGFMKVAASLKYDVIQNMIAPLQERYKVQLPEGFEIKTIPVTPQPQVLLKEFNNQYLMLQSQFLYEDVQVDYSNNPEDIISSLPDGSLQVIKRDAALEKQFFESLRGLHNTFDRQWQNDFFYVHFNEVMKENWFLNTVRYLQENNFTVKGMQELKRFRYNTNKPKWEMKTGSGIDWFDLQVKISFGEQEVTLKEVRKALLSKQNIVVLGDGTFGVLPEEWLEQYGMLLKMGDDQKDGSLRLSKLHFTIIDDLHNEIDNEAVLQEIETKKQKLRDIETIQTSAISKSIKAKLRPYQVSGFQWLQTLDELGWGGCLADDMGLGKTLQAITFLQCMKEKYKGSTHLVVCPTSLIYNWEAELIKFAPKLKYHIYYGTGRAFTDEHFENYDVIITSYGLVRNDMEQLLRFQWHYVILDESQAIKNPDAQTTKAVQLLKSKNRLILSGTPVQNNTFDLFAQFNFLNAGLLGNKEFYKTEFANPIDKYNDADKSKQLRKLVYPFLLRRTKEEVAKDLPAKTETILWCQLAKEQRSVYEDYKNYYRSMLMKKIEEEGMSKAGIYVLEGLLRLRQICDSPQLVKDEEVTTKESIKITELLREIEENTGSHKLLVFSQFTEMLQLIKNALEQKNISFCYLDGSTPAVKRKEQVEKFQSDESIKIFLISLKAGGLGLNLTAADYVYIVDPWWNPAVEQQAIDRTHRIGQTQKIFAYKMICKDTVEEKIIQLQQRKKQLANELVTEDAGFIKKLKKEDVEFLFS
jgi:SNF2 family DNA or RNA helicase